MNETSGFFFIIFLPVTIKPETNAVVVRCSKEIRKIAAKIIEYVVSVIYPPFNVLLNFLIILIFPILKMIT